MKRLPPLLLAASVLLGSLVWCAPVVEAADPAPKKSSAKAKTPAPPVAPVNLIGLTREEVIVARGKPSGERDRGESRVMVYTDGTRVELRGGRVVAVTGGSAGEIIGADGTRYVPGADGNIQRPVEVIEPIDPEVPAAAPVQDSTPAEPPIDSSAAPAESTPGAEVKETAGGPLAPDLPPGGTAPPSVDAAKRAATQAIAKDLADDEDADEDADEDVPPLFRAMGLLLGAVIHFGLTVLVLRLALHVIGVPFLWPDLLKVSLLYLAVYEVLHSLGELGGLWEFLPLFRIDEVISLIVLACSLTWFKIAGSGLTALKVAIATKVVLVALMLGVGLVIVLGLSFLQ